VDATADEGEVEANDVADDMSAAAADDVAGDDVPADLPVEESVAG
jgi:hypothetical protein